MCRQPASYLIFTTGICDPFTTRVKAFLIAYKTQP
jgi:hypothetical protein